MSAAPEKHAFQAEARQLLDLVIHALYSHKEIFLRELISNASDALDRLRFESLTEPKLLAGDDQLQIRLEVDKEARTLTVHDNGIGMTRDEVTANIGTIARSGTRELMTKLKQAAKSDTATPELIGQFGVGFYSAFMVADKVTLVTRKAGEETATRWESTGEGEYEIADGERDGRGTSITLHLKKAEPEDGLDDFTDRWVLKRVVTSYSDFVTYPIVMATDPGEQDDDEATDESEKSEKTDGKPEDETFNSMQAIWTRLPSEVEDSEYNEFYKHISHDWTDPAHRIAFSAEGTFEYQALIFIPGKAPFDLWYPEAKPGLQLYVKKVRIDEHCEHLVPRYLRFLKGVVDAPDLSLNVSREMLQHDRRVTQIRKRLTRKVIDSLAELRDKEPEKYRKLWNEFGRALKEGVAMDADHRERLTSLLLFESSNDSKELTRLSDYVGRMKPEQNEIYYLTGSSRAVVEGSPHLEALREKGYEVLYLVDPIDEIVVQHLSEFEGKKLRSAGKGIVETGTEEERKEAEEAREAKQKEHASLLEFLQRKLDEHIKEVRLSSRLQSSPACLVGAETDMSPQMEAMLRHSGTPMPPQKRILELNPDHAIMDKLKERFEKDRADPLIADFAELLYGQALLGEGSELPDPARFGKLVAELMVKVG